MAKHLQYKQLYPSMPALYQDVIVAQRAPRNSDKNYDVGQVWIDQPNDDGYILTKVANNLATWINIGGGTGTFNALTVTTTASIGTNLTVGGTTTLSGLGAGTLRSSAAGVLSVLADGNDGEVLIGTTAGAASWSTLTAGAGITITEAAGSITIANPGATGTTMTASDANVVSPDGAGNTDVIGYDANITTDGATANTLKVRLADDVTTVGALTAGVDFDMSSGTCTIESDTNNSQAIYLHADAGVNETIEIVSTQGTGNDAILLRSVVGGVYLHGGSAGADSLTLIATDAAGGITIGAGTGGITTTLVNGDYSLSTGTGDINIGTDVADHDITIGDDSGSNALFLASGTGHTELDSTGDIYLEADGDIEINSSAGTLNLGNDAVAQNINIGSGAAARTITIGNVTGATGLALNAGTDGIALASTGTGDITLDSDDTLLLDSDGVLELNSSGGVISIGNDDVDQAINLGTDGERTVTIGSANGAAALVLQSGTGNVAIATNATDHSTTIGSANGVSAFTAQAGTGTFTLTAGGALDIDVTGATTLDGAGLDISMSGNVTLDSSGGTIGIGVDDIDQAINIGTDGERTITIGSNNGANGTVIDCGTGNCSLGATAVAHTTTLGSTTGASDTVINSGTGGISLVAGGNVDIQPATNSAAGNSITQNSKISVLTLTGNTTASGAQETFTVTNSEISATSGLIVTVANGGTNDARLTLERVKPASGSRNNDTEQRSCVSKWGCNY